MEVSRDFFTYFEAFTPVLRADPTLMCISSWNDNGMAENAEDGRRFFRSDFFPGLGWMMTKNLWQELSAKWPATFWDDWLRLPEQRQGRACVRPEVSRTTNFGRLGVSSGQYFDQHIANVKSNTETVDFGGFDAVTNMLKPASVLGTDQSVDVRLLTKPMYDAVFNYKLQSLSTVVTSHQLRFLIDHADPTSVPIYKDNLNLAMHKKLATSLDFSPQLESSRWNFISSGLAYGNLEPTHPNSPNFCGRMCRRRYRIDYKLTPGVEKYANLVVILKEWNLMDDIRAGVARGMYQDVVCFKQKYAHSPPAIGNEDQETYVEVCAAPIK